MIALLLPLAVDRGEQSPPGPGSAIPIIIGCLIAVFLVGLALYFLIVRRRAKAPGRVPERRSDADARFDRGQAGALGAEQRAEESTDRSGSARP